MCSLHLFPASHMKRFAQLLFVFHMSNSSIYWAPQRTGLKYVPEEGLQTLISYKGSWQPATFLFNAFRKCPHTFFMRLLFSSPQKRTNPFTPLYAFWLHYHLKGWWGGCLPQIAFRKTDLEIFVQKTSALCIKFQHTLRSFFIAQLTHLLFWQKQILQEYHHLCQDKIPSGSFGIVSKSPIPGLALE